MGKLKGDPTIPNLKSCFMFQISDFFRFFKGNSVHIFLPQLDETWIFSGEMCEYSTTCSE